MSQISTVSKRYAKALYGAVKDKVATLNQLRVMVRILTEDPTVEDYFNSHTQSEQQKIEILSKAIQGSGLSQDLANFLKILFLKGRFGHLKDMLFAYESLVDSENGVTRGNVKSAVKLDQDARQRIESVISHFVKKKVILNYSEDTKLVGGVLAQVGGWTFEDTLDSHLRRLKEDLNRRAN